MRPVRLDMHGFAAFREPTTVDFTGADYFALVGSTGAGKSTVIDAMTFALYGSVPRWDDRRTVALALSPTANRGTVRLVFDVGKERYVAARELRRAASGTVTVRNARLERLVGVAGEVDVDAAETEVLAADGAVTKAVEELLGLPFEQFCVCVVLPQGEFAQFLHAKPADRQRTLTRILGLGVYEAMAKEAGAEAKAQAQRAELLAEQLGDYADATAQAAAEAAEREVALADLAERVTRALPELAEADRRVADATAQADRLRTERDQLAGLRPPEGLAELADRARDAEAAVEGARRRWRAAEAEDTEARERAAAAPPAEPLRQLRRDHAELAELRDRLPELDRRAEHASEGTTAAAREASVAAAALDDARANRDRTAADVDHARAEVNRCAEEHALLAGVHPPPEVAELVGARRAAADRRTAVRRRLAEAEEADTRARDALAAAPERSVLAGARRDHATLADAETRRQATTADLARAATRVAEADATLAEADRELAEATAEREARARANLVAALRPGLTPHEPCPVCAQPVRELPPPVEATGLAEADRAVQRATERRDQARESRQAAVAAEHRARVQLDSLTQRIEQLRSALDAAAAEAGVRLDTAEEVDRRLAEVDRLAATAREAAERLRHARRERDQAEAADTEAAKALAEAADALRAARDPLVALGAPAVDAEDLAGSWRALADWAAGLAADRAERLTAARQAVHTAEGALTAAEAAVLTAAERAERARRAETEAVRAEQDARGELARARRRADELAAALAEAPSDAELARRLAELAALAARATAADAELRAARAALADAERAARQVATEVEHGWRALATARDPLVGLGAPSVTRAPTAPSAAGAPGASDGSTGEELLAGWAELTGWARSAAADRDHRLPAAEAEVTAAGAARDAAERALADDLAGHRVALPADQPLAVAAPPTVAAALERAKAAVARVAERRARAARLAADRAAAEEAAQVARMLAGLLRSDAFPRWLVASALDTLVVDASRVLGELSSGQFELTHADGEFLVIDHADADARRPVKTLSGGETFQASLALALALAEQLSTLAAAGAARLDSIFLDEGFGTLDEANLDTVASTLENLAAWGDRMVGVVTHVSALAERVPIRFAVSRDQRTASIVREGG